LETLEFHRVDEPHVIQYSRRWIPNDQEVAPYTLTGFRRTVFLVLYAVIVLLSIGGVVYTLAVNPLFGLMILPISYLFNNLQFAATHSILHASFIELRESEMGVVCHHAFIHHYRNTGVFHETWLETRVSYFIDPRAIFDRAFRGFVVLIPLTSVILYQIDPVLGIAFLSSQYLAELIQSTIHEWYHNPVRSRQSFYSFPVYWGFTLLEKIGLASSKAHMLHHGHQLHALDKVAVWLDLYVPFVETAASRIWKKALTKYVPGQAHMTAFLKRAGGLFALLVFSLICPAVYAVVFLAFFR
jgi:hypothetical protein